MSEPYDFLASFTRAHEDNPSAPDPTEAFDHWFKHGYVFKDPDFLLIGGEDPDDPRDDTWFVYWAEVHPRLLRGDGVFWLRTVATFIRLMPYHRPRIKFNRGVRGRFDGRIYSTDRLLRFIPGEHRT